MGTALVASIAAATAQGATVVYTSQASFLAAAGGVGPADTFNGLTTTTSRGAVTGAYNDFAYSAALSVNTNTTFASGLGVLADPGSPSDRFLVANRFTGGSSFYGVRIDFTGVAPVTAVGANFFRYNQNTTSSAAGTVTVLLFGAMGVSLGSFDIASLGRDTYQGFTTDAAIAYMVVRSNMSGVPGTQYAAFDNFAYGAAIVPLPPAAWAGLGLLGVIGGVRTIRRRG
jgi:hypothetical protein